MHSYWWITSLLWLAPIGAEPQRVVLIGDTLIEREQRWSYVETNVLARFPSTPITFRNLGWSADTPNGVSRAYFDPPAEGRKRLVEEVVKQKPSILIVGYGMADSFGGIDQAPAFGQALNKMIDDVAPKSQYVFLAPIRHEDLGRPFPDPTEHNRSLAEYAKTVAALAGSRSGKFVDLFNAAKTGDEKWTGNGIHPTESGYWKLALEAERLLDLPRQTIALTMDAKGTIVAAVGTKATNVQAKAGEIAFDQTDDRLPTPTPPEKSLRHERQTDIMLTFTGLEPGKYSLAIEGQKVATAEAKEWASGVTLVNTPQHQQIDELRQAAIRKNRCFFLQYRPQNITYLLGFRKHEQGQNASELEDLNQHIETLEKKMDELKVPKMRRVTLKREAA